MTTFKTAEQFRKENIVNRIAIEDHPLIPRVNSIILAANERKCEYIKAIRVDHITEISDFIIIMQSNNKPQSSVII